MNRDSSNSPNAQDQLPACYRCHASKVRCRRAPGQVRCRRCTRAAYPDCNPRPSRRGRNAGGGQSRGPRATTHDEGGLPPSNSSSNNNSNISDLGQGQGHEGDMPHALLDHVGPQAVTMEWESLGGLPLGDSNSSSVQVNGLDPTIFPLDLATLDVLWPKTSSHPSVSTEETSLAEPTIASSSSRNDTYPSWSGSERRESFASSPLSDSRANSPAATRRGVVLHKPPTPNAYDRLSSASYVQALADLHTRILAQSEATSNSIRQFLASPTTRQGRSPTGGDHHYPRSGIGEGPVERTLGLALALRSLLRPRQTADRDMSTTIMLLSTVLRLATLLYDLLAQLQGILAQVPNTGCAIWAWLFPPVQLGSLLLDARDDDRIGPLQMHSVAIALRTAEGLIDEVIQLTERTLPDHHMNDAPGGAGDDGNTPDDFGLQALMRALVAKQEAVVERISTLRDML